MSRRVIVLFVALLAAQLPASLKRSAAGEEKPVAIPPLSVGAATASFKSDDSMQIAGGIGPGRATGQEGDLRAVAIVLEHSGSGKIAIVACDVLFVTRAMIDRVAAQIEKSCGIPASHLLVNATHTHHAPSTVRVHGTEPEPAFIASVEQAIVAAVEEANRRLTPDCRMSFALNDQVNVGKNSRLLLSDDTIFWIGPADDAVRPTGPFDPHLPVLSFRGGDGRLVAALYNHSTHTIGTLAGGVRSPSFYGLAAQALEKEWKAPVLFLEGASGSTHNLTHGVADAIAIMQKVVADGMENGTPVAVERLAAIKRPFRFNVRTFDEAVEDQKVVTYCTKRAPGGAETIIKIFRDMRRELSSQQGQPRETWLQAVLVGDVAIVGVPAEFFTGLGIEIKKRSPIKRTYVAELANDWIGYLPDREAHKLGGYQTWMGLHSYAEVGTGERVVDEAVAMLKELVEEGGSRKEVEEGARESLQPLTPDPSPTRGEGRDKHDERGAGEALTPREELATFRLHDPQLVVELVAAEPDVDSPVALAWDAAGRMYVAEMSDYPLGPEKGRVRVLEDRDGDGRYEHSRVFAKDIAFPTSVLPCRDGLLVSAAPEILLLEDTDGDGEADERTVLLTGFGVGNQQLRVNGLVWGADNWIYGANGRSDGNVRRPQDPPGKAVSIAGRDFRFRPDGSAVEAVTGQSQFGLARDDWGQRFCSWNTIVLRHALMPPAVLEAHPQLADIACRDVADPADNTQIFPISPRPQTFNRESTEHYNALCGLAIFRGDGLGSEYVGDAFVCESLRNLVHRRKLVADGPTFVSKRAVAGGEFLASTDPWFHPVFIATGPDGALYIADFYRRWVEHPQWVADANARESTDWRQGAAHGRIWRVRHRDLAVGAAPPALDRAATSELLSQLASPNGWRRDTAQCLLVERRDAAARPLLAELVIGGKTPQLRFHAVSTLAGIDGPEAELLTRALADSSPQVRRQAARLAAPLLAGAASLRAALLAAAADSDPAVRFEVAIAISTIDDPQKGAALEKLWAAGDDNRWDGVALEIGIGRSAWHFFNQLVETQPGVLDRPTPRQEALLASLCRLVGRNRDQQEIAACFDRLSKDDFGQPNAGQIAALSGLVAGMADAGVTVRQLRSQPPDRLKEALSRLPSIIHRACQIALSEAATTGQRQSAIRILAHCAAADEMRPLAALLAAGIDQPLANAAAEALVRAADARLAADLFVGWSSYAIATRQSLPALSLRWPTTARALADAIESGTVDPLELDATARDALLQSPDAELVQRIKVLLAASTPADRTRVLAEYEGAVTMTANRQHGAELVTRHCLACHQIQGRGRRLGPDLSGIGSHRKEELLVSLLDPSRQVSGDFIAYTLVTTDGQILSGLVGGETAAAVTLRRADGTVETVPRDRVEVLRASGKSLMPEGFEQKLSVQDVADMLEYLVHPDAALLGAATIKSP